MRIKIVLGIAVCAAVVMLARFWAEKPPVGDVELEAQAFDDNNFVPAIETRAGNRSGPTASSMVSERREEAVAQPESREQLSKRAEHDLQQRMQNHPSVEDEYLAEPVAASAQVYEATTWEKVAALPGVESAVVQCRTSTCKVTMSGKINAATGFDIKGLTFYGSGPDGWVFFYDKDLDVE